MTPAAFTGLAELVKARSGIVLTPDKQYMLDTRLAPLLRREKLAGLDALAVRVRQPAGDALLQEVVEALTTNESSFFRDSRPFEHLRRVLPAMLARGPAGAPLRIWSAACSTGQEAYSAAMLALGLGPAPGRRRVEILGTDIAREVVERAREGLFTQFEVQRGLPVQLLVKHFRKEGTQWRIAPELRAMARFEHANLLQDTARFGRFDVIFCRNVLIYFDMPTKSRVLGALTAQLAPGGVLYLGGAETMLGLETALVPVAGERGVYEAAGAARAPAA
ncbi:protein-glutamate O-methyltransferase [Roseomonas sp. NAR14]|uniref:protein-glutamate O-methyltransferase n=1 Tax=Roseomonas acroporae TaxID=2937791 RepID=A0A9X1YCD2_9PROT|nr:protein-glutamate O-methyltransferase [Roseomonas acroporae]MCK8786410.1 protein-glutamate O-methyltransferase [Roseomonas acroporae]